MFVVFDLDDTLACTKHRRPFIIPEGQQYATYAAHKNKADANGFKPDWDSFFAARSGDTPLWGAVELFHSLTRNGNHVEIWTAAREDSREVTRSWLREQCGIDQRHLTKMRPIGDYRKAVELKESWLLSASPKPDIFFDDHIGIIRMVRSHGVFGAAVGEHDY